MLVVLANKGLNKNINYQSTARVKTLILPMPQSQHISLRPLQTNDSEVLATLANNKKIWDNLRDRMPYPYTTQHAESYIAMTMSENPTCNFGIIFKGELCGIIGINLQQDVYAKSVEIGYWLGEAYWGKGIATEALRQMTAYVEATFPVVRIFTSVFGNNIASMKVLEKNGYVKEAVFKKGVFKNGVVLDEHRYAKIL